MSSLIPIDEEEGVTRVDQAGASRTVRDLDALTVSSYHETVNITWATSARQPLRTFVAWVTSSSYLTFRRNIEQVNSASGFFSGQGLVAHTLCGYLLVLTEECVFNMKFTSGKELYLRHTVTLTLMVDIVNP